MSGYWVQMYLAVVLWPCNASFVIIDLAANRARRGERRVLYKGGEGADGTLRVCGIYIFTWVHIHVYMQVRPSVCAWALRLPGKWMCWPHQSLQLVERLRKRCLGSSPVRGEFASVLPWHWTGLGLWWMEMDGGEVGGWVGGWVGAMEDCVCVLYVQRFLC